MGALRPGEVCPFRVRGLPSLGFLHFPLLPSARDKERSLTDCISFVVMQDEQLTEALHG
jgi:hypothetical protein